MTDETMKILENLLTGKQGLTTQTAALEFMLPLSDRQIQLILRDTDPTTLTHALAGASGTVMLRIYSTMGDRGARVLNEDVDLYLENHRIDEIVAAQISMENIFKNLKE